MPHLSAIDVRAVLAALASRDEAECAAAHGIVTKAAGFLATSEERERANDLYGTDDVEIDDEPATSPADDGTWVSAWVWLPTDDGEEVDDDE